MKTRYKITVIAIITFIPISIFFPQIFLVFHLDKFEISDQCNTLNGNWDWINDVCNLQHIEIEDHDSMCRDIGGTPTCENTCGAYSVSPWSSILPLGCLDMCRAACEFDGNEK